MADYDSGATGGVQVCARIFGSAIPMQICLHEIKRQIGKTDGLSCLDVGFDNGMMIRQLRKWGGKWHSLVSSPGIAGTVNALVEDNVGVMTDSVLPFEDKVFDVLVVREVMERTVDDTAFIQECHRVMKPDGRLILSVRHKKMFTLMNLVRRIARVRAEDLQWARSGYSEKVLFNVLKTGFDVTGVRSYTRFLVELTDTFVRSSSKNLTPSRDGERLLRIYAMARPFYSLAYQLDMLFFMTRGYHMVVLGKRRAWRARQAPILHDGRTIGEAVLSRANS
ncbi:MAG: methyltransferase domain-containing protein [Kiritimatiellia bacterium]|nr:methyltransferase domain-containing protein [Kiritimatiellia bacterium]MDP6849283.1 methyltransferase domain-containing protein [Kiritimatiellia bacterium]